MFFAVVLGDKLMPLSKITSVEKYVPHVFWA